MANPLPAPHAYARGVELGERVPAEGPRPVVTLTAERWEYFENRLANAEANALSFEKLAADRGAELSKLLTLPLTSKEILLGKVQELQHEVRRLSDWLEKIGDDTGVFCESCYGSGLKPEWDLIPEAPGGFISDGDRCEAIKAYQAEVGGLSECAAPRCHEGWDIGVACPGREVAS